MRIVPRNGLFSDKMKNLREGSCTGLRENYDFPCEGIFTSSYFFALEDVLGTQDLDTSQKIKSVNVTAREERDRLSLHSP